MKIIDLTDNPELFLEYTASEAEKELGVIEGHGKKVKDKKGDEAIIGWCLSCIRKHLGNVEKLSEECGGGRCPVQPIWEGMREWAKSNRDKLTRVIKQGELITQEEAEEITAKAIYFRKEMEKIVLGRSSEEESEKYLT